MKKVLVLLFLFILIIPGCSRKPRTVHTAAFDGDLTQVESFVKEDPSVVSHRDDEGRTPLHYAARNGHLDIVQFLLKNGADINAYDTEGWTPMRFAKFKGQMRTYDYLKAQGATEY